MKVDRSVAAPRLIAWLGYGGAVPFLALTVLTYVDREREVFWHGSLRAYGAVILSFVGALHWGFAMTLAGLPKSRRNTMAVWSVIPGLIAFAALIAHGLLTDLLLTSGFLLHYLQDRRVAASTALPAWYLPLRLRLSAFVIMCVAAGAFAGD